MVQNWTYVFEATSVKHFYKFHLVTPNNRHLAKLTQEKHCDKR